MRTSSQERNTKETQIKMTLNIDGSGIGNINSGIGFFDHMLNSFAKHGNFNLDLDCKGDLNVDCHHTVEDIGIVLGTCFKEALGNKEGINRYASFVMPMDDALVLCAVDFSGRPYLNFSYDFKDERISDFDVYTVGDFETETLREFLYSVSYAAGMNLHIKIMDGANTHHIIEAIFKAMANAMRIAASKNPDREGILSTKGAL
ncbi:MAG: imidazoleglycerol-phosphate dehydratase HisB [Lachnospiraceae bacterium]|nr:imidazoleglycerol-phosphate dehydratase HisB [Lachnospiraceae bacterium]